MPGAEERLGVFNQLVRFVVIGAACAVVDSGTYAILLGFGWTLWLAKAVSFVLGTTASYVVNRRFTFRGAATGNTTAKAGGFALVYTVTFFMNVGTNQVVNIALHDAGAAPQVQRVVGWVVAQGVATLINFAMLKWVVFKER